jgi:XisI protein
MVKNAIDTSLLQETLRERSRIYFMEHERALFSFDTEQGQYLVLAEGWNDKKHLHSVIAHLEIREGKIWILQDNTQEGVATWLLDAGFAKDQIVLGFKHASLRPYTEFAAA